MWHQVSSISGVTVIAFTGLAASNLLNDRGVDNSISRCLAGALGGVSFLAAVLWLDPWTAVALMGALTLLIVVLRLGFRRGLRGARGKQQSQEWAEVTYAVGGTASLAIGWGLLGDKWLAFLPIAFMAWGDNAAGLARATIWRGNIMSLWPSVAMLCFCLGLAVVFKPFWIGAVGAAVAVTAERFRPKGIKFWDDNLNIVIISLAIMGILSRTSI
jgi:hypothetical protein